MCVYKEKKTPTIPVNSQHPTHHSRIFYVQIIVTNHTPLPQDTGSLHAQNALHLPLAELILAGLLLLWKYTHILKTVDIPLYFVWKCALFGKAENGVRGKEMDFLHSNNIKFGKTAFWY